MKQNYRRNVFSFALVCATCVGGVAYAGQEETIQTPASAARNDVVSGALNLDFNSHYFSYGNDTWNDGDDAFTMGFYPSAELSLALPAGFTATFGVWAEIHDKTGATSTIGSDIQEVDLSYGLAYTYEKFTVGVVYQNWIYGSDTEDILDVSFAYDCFLSPSLSIHNRLNAGAAGVAPGSGDEGTIVVLGLEHGLEAGPVSITFPFNLAYFVDDGYHQAGADSGFGYASLGVQASVPLSSVIGDAYGDWSLNAGFNYYLTDDDVIGKGFNAEDSFFTTNVGLSLSF